MEWLSEGLIREGNSLALSSELQPIASQAAVALRKAGPQRQSMLLTSQSAFGMLCALQVCYSTLSMATLDREIEKAGLKKGRNSLTAHSG